MRFAEELINNNPVLWERATSHPFLDAVADGSIDDDTFLRWLEQDYIFVEGGLRYLAAVIETAPGRVLVDLSKALATLADELVLFREQAEAHGADLDDVELLPTNRAYQDYLTALGYKEAYAENLCAIWTLERAYHEAWLSVRERTSEDESKWWEFVDNWSSVEFGEWVSWLEEELNTVAKSLDDDEKERLEEIFIQCSEYEARFWDMCWEG